MLKNRYQEILVGVGPMSLIRGIISLKRNRSTLIIDDKRFVTENYPGLFLSELEILSLLRLGKKYEIPELLDLKQFLVPASFNLVTESRRVLLGRSPLTNLKEVLRKYPEFLDASDLDLLYGEQEETFNRYFMGELARFETQSFEASMRPKGYRFELQGPKWMKTIYARFNELLNKEYDQLKDLKFKGLLHLLGIANEEKLKTRLLPEEVPYYFFRMLSPLYRLQDFFLTTQLKRRLVLLGGDYKESTIQFWQMHENKFENLLLASFEGVISGDRVLFFSHLPEEVPFGINSPFHFYRKAQVNPVKRHTAPFPPTSLTFITDTNLLGSERPYRVMAQNHELAYYQWPYPELPGSKSEFYDRSLSEAFIKDASLLPFEKGVTELGSSGSVTMDLRSLRIDRKSEAPILEHLPLEIAEGEKPIKGFEYWGPFRYRSLGLLALSYGVEGI